MSLRIGLQKPGSNFIARAIAAHDAPHLYCHAALIFDDGLICEAHADFGVRFHEFKSYDPAPWDFWTVGLDLQPLEAVGRFCDLRAGDGYDLCGVAHFDFSIIKQDASKWFCSELVVAALQQAGLLVGIAPSSVSPNRLATLLADAAWAKREG